MQIVTGMNAPILKIASFFYELPNINNLQLRNYINSDQFG